jgi:GTP cyclohydrolase II
MSSYKQEVAARLRERSEKKFGPGLNASARGYSMSPENLSQYWTGKILPGNKMQARFREAGGDVNWLMTGEYASEASAKYAKIVERDLKDGITEADKEMITMLHKLGVRSISELTMLIGLNKVLGKLGALNIESEHANVRQAAEAVTEYLTTKKRKGKS